MSFDPFGVRSQFDTGSGQATLYSLKKLEEAGIDPVLFGLTDKDYEMLAKNFAQIRHYIQKQNLIIESYKNYYEPSNKKKIENTPVNK